MTPNNSLTSDVRRPIQSPDIELKSRNAVLARVVSLLAACAYEEVVVAAPKSRITAAQMCVAVGAYGYSLVPLPPYASTLIDDVAIAGANPNAWSVVVPLFTHEEGRSDLSLVAQMTRTADGHYEVEVNDIHVL